MGAEGCGNLALPCTSTTWASTAIADIFDVSVWLLAGKLIAVGVVIFARSLSSKYFFWKQ